MPSRRELLAALTTVWLARAVHAARAAPAAMDEALRARLRKLQDLSRALARREIEPLAWQKGAAQVCDGIDLQELCRVADFERVIARLPLLPRGTSAESIQLLEGQAFTPKIFAMGKGRAIIPHGHRNMVSQHLVLQGEMRGRHYQRVGDEPGHLRARPTIDKAFRAGDFSSISDQRDNVHWFVTSSERAYTLDAIVDNLDASRPYRFHIDFVDPDKATLESDGSLRMPRLELDECLQRYG
ncbi:MAG: hypothetical protein ACXWLR_00670 [Myxococcales bacterium]